MVSIVDERTRESLGGLVERSITSDALTAAYKRNESDEYGHIIFSK